MDSEASQGKTLELTHVDVPHGRHCSLYPTPNPVFLTVPVEVSTCMLKPTQLDFAKKLSGFSGSPLSLDTRVTLACKPVA